jgi:hypothetical protein
MDETLKQAILIAFGRIRDVAKQGEQKHMAKDELQEIQIIASEIMDAINPLVVAETPAPAAAEANTTTDAATTSAEVVAPAEVNSETSNTVAEAVTGTTATEGEQK